MKSTTGGQHSFAKVPTANIERSAFNRSCGMKTTFDAGFLIPIFWDEMLPGDTVSLQMTHFARLSTQLHPVLDNLRISTFFFATPNRILWDNWEKFCGAQDDPGDSTSFTVPKVTQSGSVLAGSIADHMGMPTDNGNYQMNALYPRAIMKIWNEWFRDENLQDSLVEESGDASTLTSFINNLPPKRGKRHDYFTSALPFPQKGPSVSLPLGTVAPVVTTGAFPQFAGQGSTVDALQVAGTASNELHLLTTTTDGSVAFGPVTGLETDLSTATAATINQLREAFQIQRIYERDARGGTRYVELLKSHFGVTSPDFRLQRPEYLGGGTSMVQISQVNTTSESGGNVGDLGAYGTSSATHGFSKSFVEHSIVIGFVCLTADLNYQETLPREMSRTTRWDYFWPALARLGEQAILNQELLYQDVAGTGATDDQGVFGYQERYAEYRYKPSLITGKFRSAHATSIDIWHLAQDFAGVLPALDSDFIEENPPIDRILAVPSEPHMLFDAYFQYKHVRPMPTYGIPGMIDHF